MLSVQYAKDLAIQAWEWQASRFRGVKQQDKFKTFRTFLVFFFHLKYKAYASMTRDYEV